MLQLRAHEQKVVVTEGPLSPHYAKCDPWTSKDKNRAPLHPDLLIQNLPFPKHPRCCSTRPVTVPEQHCFMTDHFPVPKGHTALLISIPLMHLTCACPRDSAEPCRRGYTKDESVWGTLCYTKSEASISGRLCSNSNTHFGVHKESAVRDGPQTVLTASNSRSTS